VSKPTLGPDGYFGSSDWEATNPPRRPYTRDRVVDAECIGAVLDGALSGAERDAALVEIPDSDDDETVFADTAGVLREVEAGEQ
jgi:hypothetical protein